MTADFVFVLSEKLPRVEPVISIYNYTPGGSAKKGKETKRRKAAVNAC